MLRDYFISIMKDQRRTFDGRIVGMFLSAISFVYLGILTLIYWMYKTRLLSPCRVKPKVISVGNLTLGGTGKTPFTITLTEKVVRMGKRPAVLIRGYGDDEPHMLRDRLREIPVLVGADRVRNADIAYREQGSLCVILDDGFQHRRIHRDLDIVLVDASSPFDNTRIFPRGTLREPLSRLKDAQVAVVTKADMEPAATRRICEVIRRINREIDIVQSHYEAVGLCDVFSQKEVHLSYLKGRKVLLLAGIANPAYFEWMVRRLNCNIVGSIFYSDHYPYKPTDIRGIAKRCLECDARTVVTTEKDAVRLRRDLKSYEGVDFLALKIDCRLSKNEEKIDVRLSSVFDSQVL